MKVIRFIVTDEEKAKIEAEAKKAGLTMSTLLRLLFRDYSDGIRFERRERKE